MHTCEICKDEIPHPGSHYLCLWAKKHPEEAAKKYRALSLGSQRLRRMIAAQAKDHGVWFGEGVSTRVALKDLHLLVEAAFPEESAAEELDRVEKGTPAT